MKDFYQILPSLNIHKELMYIYICLCGYFIFARINLIGERVSVISINYSFPKPLILRLYLIQKKRTYLKLLNYTIMRGIHLNK